MADEHRKLFEGLLDRSLVRQAGGYRVYTRAHDVEVHARDLNDTQPGGRAGPGEAAEAIWRTFEERRAVSLGWVAGQAAEITAFLRAAAPEETRRDTVVTVLLDQSGSMKGDKMVQAARAITACEQILTPLGVRLEVLGFTSVDWRGGKPRAEWMTGGKPRMPGRLNALLHIVYRGADETGPIGEPVLRAMLDPQVAKENIDGEALEWAAGRLRARPEHLKLLFVLSDGAPVDDSTLYHNTKHYLWDHLHDVVRDLTAAGDIVLGGVGIGYDVSGIYPNHRRAETPEDIAPTLLDFIESLLARHWSPPAPPQTAPA